MLSVLLSYNTTISWKILIQYGGKSRQFIRLKRFINLKYPGGGHLKGIMFQGRNLPSGLPVICQS